MKVVHALSMVVVLLWLSACSRTVNACPEGMVREGDRCVMEDIAELGEDDPVAFERGAAASRPGLASPEHDVWTEEEPNEGGVSSPIDLGLGEDSGSTLDASAPADAASATDASLGVDAGRDAGAEAGSIPRDADILDAERDAGAAALDASDAASDADATLWSDALVPDDAMQDASDATDANDAAADSGHDDGAMPPLCSENDLSSWRAFQVGGSLIQAIASCYAADPRCARGACDLAACMRRAAGVGGCVECVAEETRCALTACTSACSASDTSDACRACACRQGCIGGTSACGMGPMDACRDCRGDTCNNRSLDPALIMVIVNAS